MELKEFDAYKAGLVLSRLELRTVGKALNEVCNGFEVADFESKMGAEVGKVDKILDDIIPVYRQMKQSGSPYVSVRFSRFELRAIIGALKEICVELDPAEFRTRMAATRDEVDQILNSIIPIYTQMKQDEGSAGHDG